MFEITRNIGLTCDKIQLRHEYGVTETKEEWKQQK
jgi:hypothetical protein